MPKQFRYRGECTALEAQMMTAKLYQDGWNRVSCDRVSSGFFSNMTTEYLIVATDYNQPTTSTHKELYNA